MNTGLLDRRARRKRERRVVITASGLTALGILTMLLVGLRVAAVAGDAGSHPPSKDARSIAVLPFQSLSDDRQSAHFGIGLADSIINNLSGLPELTVRPMSTTLKVSAGVTDPVETGKLLRVGTVLTGTYQQVADRFEVTARLIDTATGAVLSERTFESEIGDLMGMERTVVTRTLAILAPGQRAPDTVTPSGEGAPDATAHYLYLLALGKLAMFQGASVPDAVELLEQAIQVDPDYAPAHAALSVACSNMLYSGMTADSSWNERAIASARRAIYLDERSPSAHHALGHALLGAGDPVEAAREALIALNLDPDHPRALRLLATLLTGAGLPAQVKRLRARIVSIDPDMDVGWLDIYLGFREGNPQGTIAAFEDEVQRRLAADESIESQVMRLGYMSFKTGNSAAALRWAATMESVTANKDFVDLIRMLALARTGDAEGVMAILRRNRATYEEDWESCAWIGMALALIGQHGEAIAWVERSAQLGSYDYELLDNSLELDTLRADPRFEAAISVVRGRAREIIELAAFAGYR